MPKAAVDVKRSKVTRLIRAAHDAGLTVTGIRSNGPEIEVITGRVQDSPAVNEWDTHDKDPSRIRS